MAAIWRGVNWLESLHIGSQHFSTIRNFTILMCPFMAAWWSGVSFFSSKHDGLQPWSVKYLTMCRWPNSAAKWSSVLPYSSGVLESYFQTELLIKNWIMSKCPFTTAKCRAKWFLLVGSQCSSRVRNFTISVWPFMAAQWRGVLWSESWHIESQCFSTVRNFTTSMCPSVAAQWSGVCFSLSKHDGLHPCLSVKYLTMCRWPEIAAIWREVLPYRSEELGSQFWSDMRKWVISICPSITARCRAVAL